MVSENLYRQLVPGAPLHRRTDRDPVSDESRARYEALRAAVPPTPGLADPRLHSTWQGRIDEILFAFPASAVGDAETVAAYRSVIGALRPGTAFVVVHSASVRPVVEEWFRTAGHTDPDLAPLDAHVTKLWEELGFEVHALADFTSFARRQGVVHCIKKYLHRGD